MSSDTQACGFVENSPHVRQVHRRVSGERTLPCVRDLMYFWKKWNLGILDVGILHIPIKITILALKGNN